MDKSGKDDLISKKEQLIEEIQLYFFIRLLNDPFLCDFKFTMDTPNSVIENTIAKEKGELISLFIKRLDDEIIS